MLYRENQIANTWTTVGPLAAEEVWQCRKGRVAICLEAVTDDEQGTVLNLDDVLYIPAGKTVRFRKITKESWINREVVG